MSTLRSPSFLATTLLFTMLSGFACSVDDRVTDFQENPSAGAGGVTATGSGGTSGGSGAAAGSGGGAGSTGSAGSSGAASGSGGAAGSATAEAGSSGAAGSEPGVDGGSEFPVPDKLVALTFDDGPAVAQTGAVLDKLEFHQVPASFFLIGQNISAGTQAVLQRAASLGCEFENHSFGFGSLTGLQADAVEASVNDTTAAIVQFTGTNPAFFRPPNLATDTQMFNLIDLPFAGGLVGGDFPGGNPTVEAISNTVLNGVQDGSIILLHDVQASLNPHPTPAALDIIIPELRQRGFEIVTLRQLFARRGVDPNSQANTLWTSVPPAD